MMTSAQIRQSFLEFFREKQHTLVPSSSLLPDSPNLLFTNAGMNQFVPIFLGERKPDVSTWSGAVKGADTRAADTQKCIRAGGKHNDLEDVGFDTYHHTFFEMLGNWSFGDYFKKEAIEWAWELVIERWGFPANRLYATIYQPGEGDPATRDEEAWGLWAAKFRAAGLDPAVHIVNGNKKDNFWMMGETGPCGPCSELHVDLTPAGDTQGRLVNQGSAECIEIWNLVFIQFNANADGTFSPLPAQHVDTGMGFERVSSIIQGTKAFTDFATARISNYETDVFRPLFDELEKLSGRPYGSTLPAPGATPTEPEQVDIAFRVIADHIRTLSFSIADGIQPGNSGRHYVLRRILRRAVRYGRTLGFTEPFFYKLAAVLARTMGEVFPEIRSRLGFVQEVLKREEEAFNRTLDKGLALFEAEAARLLGSAGFQPAGSGILPEPSATRATYHKRRLPHYERPEGIYHVTFSTRSRRKLSPQSRTAVLEAVKFHRGQRFTLFAATVMPDHVHVLLQPHLRTREEDGTAVYWSLGDIFHSIKSYSANQVNKLEGAFGETVWENESYDRLMQSDTDLEEKYHYIARNAADAGDVQATEDYSWTWIWEMEDGSFATPNLRQDAEGRSLEGRAPQGTKTPATPLVISGAFAFRLYDEQGFPLDLTELMARERGLTVDAAGFETHMEAQRARARAAQKREVIELSQLETTTPTRFVGYGELTSEATVQEVVTLKDKTAVVLDVSPAYAEMGGQVGDTGELSGSGQLWSFTGTQKSGATWLHFLAPESAGEAPAPGTRVEVSVTPERRRAIERHHTATHLLHWALHEVVSREATQKGSSVTPEKLTFDFNAQALTPAQVREIERLVNAKILENAPVTWIEVPHAEVKGRAEIMQAFGDKYGEFVRVVQIGGAPAALDGYSMELCGGTHTRFTGELGSFRILSEGAIAAGQRRIEAVAGLPAYTGALAESERLRALAAQLGSPLGELERRLEGLLSQQKELEKQLATLRRKGASATAAELRTRATSGAAPAIIERVEGASGDDLQHIADALKASGFEGVVFLAGVESGQVALLATVSPAFTKQFQAGKLIQTAAPLVGGKGGGRPDAARGAGKDVGQVDAALTVLQKALRS